MSDLKGKTVFITGAAKRIGATVSRVLHAAEANVIIHYRSSATAAHELATELNTIRSGSAFTLKADLCETGKLDDLVRHAISCTGQLDVLINNASSFYPTEVGGITEEQWDDLMCSNLKAPLFLSQAAAPELRKRQGCIVNMVDVHALRPLRRYPVYSAAKAGLVGLTRSLAKELGPQIRVNGIAPGVILWPEDEVNQGSHTHQQLLEKTALKREGHPEHIAAAIKFLIVDAVYTTGHILPVDGGRTLNQ